MRPPVLLLAACTSASPTPPDDVPPVETDDTGGGVAPDTDDTVPAPTTRVELGPERRCDDPAARAEDPVVRLDGGPDWQGQAFDPESNSLFVGGGFGVGDLTGDGRPDLLVTSHGDDVRLWVQGGPVEAPTFTRATDAPE